MLLEQLLRKVIRVERLELVPLFLAVMLDQLNRVIGSNMLLFIDNKWIVPNK